MAQSPAWSSTSACSELCTDGGCAKFPSCQGGGAGADTSCGPGSSSDTGTTTDCCSSFDVAGGSFDRSFDGVSYTSNVNPATVSSFRLDGFEATVGRFRNFVNAVANMNWTPAPGSGKHTHLNSGAGLTAVGVDGGGSEQGWQASWPALPTSSGTWDSNLASCAGSTWTNSAMGSEHNPINCITWYEAYAFCIWDGGFLPSEAEWNYAAGGGSEQREYPWPDTAGPADAMPPDISCAFANYSPTAGAPCTPGGAANDVGSESPLGDGKWGQSDLAGNVFEWTLDTFVPYVTPCSDCANFGAGGARVNRGGSSNLVAGVALSSYRNNDPPTTRDASIGVRCARVP